MPTSIYNALFTGSEATRLTPKVINVTAATVTITAATHAGCWITLNAATGIAVTLPVPTGSGALYTFVNMTPLSAANHTFTRGNSSDVMVGIAGIGKAAGSSTPFLAASNSNTVTLNGTTTGGLGGDELYFLDTAANQWFIAFTLWGSGTLATPFSNT